MPDFVLDFRRGGHRLGDLITQHLPVALAQAMHRHAQRLLTEADLSVKKPSPFLAGMRLDELWIPPSIDIKHRTPD